jgi:hypothetical protein
MTRDEWIEFVYRVANRFYLAGISDGHPLAYGNKNETSERMDLADDIQEIIARDEKTQKGVNKDG